MEAESFNVAIVRGTCSSPPEVRVLPVGPAAGAAASDDPGRRPGDVGARSRSLDPPAWVEELDAGDEIVVLGAVRRRFFRAGGATASRVEIEAEVVCRARDRRRSRGLRRRVEELLEALDA